MTAINNSCQFHGRDDEDAPAHINVQLANTPLTSNVYVGTSLVDMYATCGSVNDARLSFIRIVNPHVAAYTVVRSTNLYTTNVYIHPRPILTRYVQLSSTSHVHLIKHFTPSSS
ncbi:hypothetical protein Hdeb2414_s0033g00722751 [Helianthus debilis subsp. tardiflorus]